MTLAERIKKTSKLSGEFVLRSGVISGIYFDKYQFEADPHLLKAIAEALALLVPSDTEVLAGLELGGIPVVTLLSQITGLPTAFIRKQAKPYGTSRYAEGANLIGKKFVLIEDVVSSGGAIIDALKKLRADNLNPTLVICVIDRQTGGREALDSAGLKLASLLTLDQIERIVDRPPNK